MHTALTVYSSVTIGEGCPMSCTVLGSGKVHFFCSIPTDSFEFSFEAAALRDFLELGSKALADMDARYAEEEARAAMMVSRGSTGAQKAGVTPSVAEAEVP